MSNPIGSPESCKPDTRQLTTQSPNEVSRVCTVTAKESALILPPAPGAMGTNFFEPGEACKTLKNT